MPSAINDFGEKARIYTGENCIDLPVLEATDEADYAVCISCWQFTWDELAHIIDNDGKVYLYVYGGAQPPVYVDDQNPLLA